MSTYSRWNPALFEDFGNEQFGKVSVYPISAYIVKHCLSGGVYSFGSWNSHSGDLFWGWVEKLEMNITDMGWKGVESGKYFLSSFIPFLFWLIYKEKNETLIEKQQGLLLWLS